jgi:NAD(P)-dependent dehydrogenase (short-subunit alcohol dehydrogenase family)
MDWKNQHDGVKALTPLHRSATPEDCVEATLGLLRTTYATGQIFAVDGGLTQVL